MSPDNSKNLARDLNADGFIARFGGVFEHSPWIAEAALAANPGLLNADVGALHTAIAAVLRDAGPERQLAVLRAHPDLAGKLALAGELTADSSAEQAGAGLDRRGLLRSGRAGAFALGLPLELPVGLGVPLSSRRIRCFLGSGPASGAFFHGHDRLLGDNG